MENVGNPLALFSTHEKYPIPRMGKEFNPSKTHIQRFPMSRAGVGMTLSDSVNHIQANVLQRMELIHDPRCSNKKLIIAN